MRSLSISTTVIFFTFFSGDKNSQKSARYSHIFLFSGATVILFCTTVLFPRATAYFLFVQWQIAILYF